MANRLSSTVGDTEVRGLRARVVEEVKSKAKVALPPSMTIDQLIRAAAKAGVFFTLVPVQYPQQEGPR